MAQPRKRSGLGKGIPNRCESRQGRKNAPRMNGLLLPSLLGLVSVAAFPAPNAFGAGLLSIVLMQRIRVALAL
jgi:hypothetical protein